MKSKSWITLLSALLSIGASTCREAKDTASAPGSTTSSPAAQAIVSLPGIDLSALTPREQREWSEQVSQILAPCADTPVPIAQCVKEGRACKTCLPGAEFLLGQVRAGRSKKEREDAFRGRFDPAKVRTIALDGSPEKGASKPLVTIVEWADFECPFCGMMAPLLEDFSHRYPDQLRLVFKFYPLPSHQNGEPAARATIAAMNQGKFWKMHEMLFANQERLAPTDLERYAKDLGLNLDQFRQDMKGDMASSRIEKDKKQGEELGLQGTPLLFINGREVDLQALPNVPDDLDEWIRLEITLAGGKLPPKVALAPAPSASAPPAAAGK